MFALIIIYIIAAYLEKTNKVVRGLVDVHLVEEELFSFVKSIFYFLTIVQLFIVIFIRKTALRIPTNIMQLKDIELSYHQIISKYGTNLIFSLFLANSIGFYGLILCALNSDFQSLYLFNAIAVLAMILHRPKVKALEKLCINMKQNI
jgi:hypothetical protein